MRGKYLVRVNGLGAKQSGSPLWYESLPNDQSWFSLWSAYVRCVCGGIRSLKGQCPVCGEDPPSLDWVVVRDADGSELRVPSVFMGADGRFEGLGLPANAGAGVAEARGAGSVCLDSGGSSAFRTSDLSCWCFGPTSRRA